MRREENHSPKVGEREKEEEIRRERRKRERLERVHPNWKICGFVVVNTIRHG